MSNTGDKVYLDTVLSTIVDGLIMIDDQGIIQNFNLSAEKIFGYSADEVIGHNVKMLMPDPYHSEHDGYISNYKRTGDAQIIGIGREVEARRKDGSTIPIELGVNSMMIDGSRMFIGTIRDISERKKSMEEILRSNTELERFAYVASHDLQEPLRMVVNFTQLLEEKYADHIDDEAKQYIDFAAGSARRMQVMVSDLLEYSRIGQEAENVEDVDLNHALALALDNLSESIKSANAKVSYPDDLPVVRGNLIRILRVFQNLIGNSIKYKSEDHDPEIIIKAKISKGMCEVMVGDNGIGFKQEYSRKIFEPFKRLHVKTEYSGTGMGLAICRKIIESEGGKFRVVSQLGAGAKFYFTLPLSKIKNKK